jgi:Uma2 family endonuclease
MLQPQVDIPGIPWKPNPVSAITIAERARIPAWVVDLGSFRRWARSEEYPDHGWFSYLHGELWVDVEMEQLFSHNLVKTELTTVLGGLVKSRQLGYFFSDRALLSNPDADLSTEPDGMFVSWEAIRTGRVRLVKGMKEGYVELEGSPDIVLEVVSPNSVHKDTELLPPLYWRANIAEYWLVDARGQSPRFEILHCTSQEYRAQVDELGRPRSGIFNGVFQLTQQADPLGHPQYTLTIVPQ